MSSVGVRTVLFTSIHVSTRFPQPASSRLISQNSIVLAFSSRLLVAICIPFPVLCLRAELQYLRHQAGVLLEMAGGSSTKHHQTATLCLCLKLHHGGRNGCMECACSEGSP